MRHRTATTAASAAVRRHLAKSGECGECGEYLHIDCNARARIETHKQILATRTFFSKYLKSLDALWQVSPLLAATRNYAVSQNRKISLPQLAKATTLTSIASWTRY